MTSSRYYRGVDPTFYITDTDVPVQIGHIFCHHRNGRGIIYEIDPIPHRPGWNRIKVRLPAKRQKRPVERRNPGGHRRAT